MQCRELVRIHAVAARCESLGRQGRNLSRAFGLQGRVEDWLDAGGKA